jgi:integrase
LRVKDVDFGYRQLIVRDGKGQQDRVTMLPQRAMEPMQSQLGLDHRIGHLALMRLQKNGQPTNTVRHSYCVLQMSLERIGNPKRYFSAAHREHSPENALGAYPFPPLTHAPRPRRWPRSQRSAAARAAARSQAWPGQAPPRHAIPDRGGSSLRHALGREPGEAGSERQGGPLSAGNQCTTISSSVSR